MQVADGDGGRIRGIIGVQWSGQLQEDPYHLAHLILGRQSVAMYRLLDMHWLVFVNASIRLPPRPGERCREPALR